MMMPGGLNQVFYPRVVLSGRAWLLTSIDTAEAGVLVTLLQLLDKVIHELVLYIGILNAVPLEKLDDRELTRQRFSQQWMLIRTMIRIKRKP